MTPQRIQRPRVGSRGNFGDLNIPGTRAGAVVSIGLALLAWLVIPIARPFIVGAIGLGLVVGLILFWAHRKPVDPEDEAMVRHPRK